jgi:hypothetical protein
LKSFQDSLLITIEVPNYLKQDVLAGGANLKDFSCDLGYQKILLFDQLY